MEKRRISMRIGWTNGGWGRVREGVHYTGIIPHLPSTIWNKYTSPVCDGFDTVRIDLRWPKSNSIKTTLYLIHLQLGAARLLYSSRLVRESCDEWLLLQICIACNSSVRLFMLENCIDQTVVSQKLRRSLDAQQFQLWPMIAMIDRILQNHMICSHKHTHVVTSNTCDAFRPLQYEKCKARQTCREMQRQLISRRKRNNAELARAFNWYNKTVNCSTNASEH